MIAKPDILSSFAEGGVVPRRSSEIGTTRLVDVADLEGTSANNS
jgi:hypothetical protein